MSDLRSLVASSHPDTKATPPPQPPRRPIRARIAAALPLLLVLAFLLLLWLLFGDRLARATELEFAPVLTLPVAGAETPSTTPGATAKNPFEQPVRFQASGWIEASPYPLRATTLVDGTIETIEVLQGDSVSAGQLLATLVDDDAKLDHATAQAALRSHQAQRDAAIAREAAASARLVSLDLDVAAAEAKLEELQDEAQRLAKIGARAVPAGDISQSRLRVRSQRAQMTALASRRTERIAELEARRADTRAAESALCAAQTELARRELVLARTRILSPVDGIIQRLHAAPGMKRRLGMDDPESATIATLFIPGQLQARIDVPLEVAAEMALGQAVRIRSNLLQDASFQGRVSQIEGQADLQRNTLQAKVMLLDPDPRLRPEMLCRAEFLETVNLGSGSTAPENRGFALYAPESAILEPRNNPFVWKLDATGEQIVRQNIRTIGLPRDGHLEVREGLQPGDRVVLNPTSDLKDGERVKTKSR